MWKNEVKYIYTGILYFKHVAGAAFFQWKGVVMQIGTKSCRISTQLLNVTLTCRVGFIILHGSSWGLAA